MDTSVHTRKDGLRDQLSVLLAVFLLTAVTFRLVEVPAQFINLGSVLGSPFALVIGPAWGLAVCLSLLTLTGTYALLRQHPAWGERAAGWWISLILPTLTALTFSLLMSRATHWTEWVRILLLGLLVTGVLVYLTYHAMAADAAHAAVLRLVFNMADYALAFVLLEALARDAGRGLVLVPAVALLQGALALDVLSAAPVERRTFLYAAMSALAAAELAWAFSYAAIPPRVMGIWLTLTLYVMAGLGGLALLGRLERRALWEFLGLALVVGLGALFLA